jgi:hypothetical protein
MGEIAKKQVDGILTLTAKYFLSLSDYAMKQYYGKSPAIWPPKIDNELESIIDAAIAEACRDKDEQIEKLRSVVEAGRLVLPEIENWMIDYVCDCPETGHICGLTGVKETIESFFIALDALEPGKEGKP